MSWLTLRHFSGRIVYEKRETNLTLEFTRKVVVGAQILIAAEYRQPRSGKSVRENKASLKQFSFNCLAEENTHECCRPSPAPSGLPDPHSLYQGLRRHCRVCSSPTFPSPSWGPPGTYRPSFLEIWWQWQQQQNVPFGCPLALACSHHVCCSSRPTLWCSVLLHGEGVAVEQAWSAWKCWHMGNLGNLFRVISKCTCFCAVSIGDPVTKVGKEGLFLLSWALWVVWEE